MASTYTTNLGIEKIATGEQSGTWGNTTNTNLDLIDQAVNGIVQITVAATGSTGSPNALTITNGSASDGRNKFIDFYSPTDLGGTVYYQLDPNDAEKIAFVRNSLGGGQTLVLFQGTYNASNDVEVPNGVDMLVKFDGTGASATVTNVFEKLQVNALSVNDGNITNVGDIALDSISADGTDINVSVSDNSATALTVKEGANTYLTIDTTNSAEKVLVSKTLDVGDNNITNVGNIALDSISADGTQIDIDITDNTASAFTISEGANNYIAITTTDGSELITVSKNSTFAGTTIADLGAVTTADINGGTIDGVTIGGASAGAGTFTTLTTGSTVTLNGGTANGVLYLNGSKVATSGSALTFDGTNFGVTGSSNGLLTTNVTNSNAGASARADSIVTSDSADIRMIATSAAYTGVSGWADTGIISTSSTTSGGMLFNVQLASPVYRFMHLATNELMRLTSTGLGIGTTSPESALHIASASGNAQLRVITGDTTSISQLIFGDSADSNTGGLQYNHSDDSLQFHVGNIGEKMRIDSSGNVGIGTTSPTTALDVQYTDATVYSSTAVPTYNIQALNLSATTGAMGGIRTGARNVNSQTASHFIGTISTATNYLGDFVVQQRNGSSTYAERLRIDSSGNVGIGTTSPFSNASYNSLTVGGGGTKRGILTLNNAAGVHVCQMFVDSADLTNLYSTTGIAFGSSSGTNILKYDSSGNLGLGVTPSAWAGTGVKAFQFQNGSLAASSTFATMLSWNSIYDGAYKYVASTTAGMYQVGGAHSWYTAASGTAGNAITFTQAMTLDASGNLLVGKTSNDSNVEGSILYADSATGASASFTSDGIRTILANRKTSDGEIISIRKDGTTVGSIGSRSSGTALQIYTSSTGIDFAGDGILPMVGSTITDNSRDIGSSSYRFKNLYLSGGVYVGGTTSANLLDDYEEGTFTPTYVSAGATFTYGATTGGRYTKIGDRVFVSGFIQTASASGGTAAEGVFIGGLPFTVGAWASERDYSLFQCDEVESFAGDYPSAARAVTNTTTAALFYRTTANGASIGLTYADLDTGTSKNLLAFTGFYRV